MWEIRQFHYLILLNVLFVRWGLLYWLLYGVSLDPFAPCPNRPIVIHTIFVVFKRKGTYIGFKVIVDCSIRFINNFGIYIIDRGRKGKTRRLFHFWLYWQPWRFECNHSVDLEASLASIREMVEFSGYWLSCHTTTVHRSHALRRFVLFGKIKIFGYVP